VGWSKVVELVCATVHEADDVVSGPALSWYVAVSADTAGELCAGEDYLAVALVFRV
jgi:hypothetical protein